MIYGSKNFKSSFVALSLLIALIFGSIKPTPVYAQENVLSNVSAYATTEFTDVPLTHDFYSTIMTLVSRGIVNGYGDGTFGPDDAVTRAQVAVMLTKALNLNTNDPQSNFVDVPENHWAASHIVAASKAGIINGYGNGLFGPEDHITRAQLSVMVANSYKLKVIPDKVKTFSDVLPTHWAKTQIDALVSNNVVGGYRDGRFGPNDNATRAQFTKFLLSAETAASAAEEAEAKSILYDRNNIKIINRGLQTEVEYSGPRLNLFIENNSPYRLMVQVRESAINGIMVDAIMSTEVSAGKSAYTNMTFSTYDLKENYIETINTLEFYFIIVDWNTMRIIDYSDRIFLTY